MRATAAVRPSGRPGWDACVFVSVDRTAEAARRGSGTDRGARVRRCDWLRDERRGSVVGRFSWAPRTEGKAERRVFAVKLNGTVVCVFFTQVGRLQCISKNNSSAVYL